MPEPSAVVGLTLLAMLISFITGRSVGYSRGYDTGSRVGRVEGYAKALRHPLVPAPDTHGCHYCGDIPEDLPVDERCSIHREEARVG